MRKVTIEIPLEVLSAHAAARGILGDVLHRAESVRFVWVDLERFLLVCRIRAKDVGSLRRKARREDQTRIEVIGKRADGTVVLRVAGVWVKGGKASTAKRFLRSFGDMSVYPMGLPEVKSGTLRVTVAAESQEARKMLRKLEGFGVPYTVARVREFGATESETPSATPQQLRVLRLAYTLGYYDVPRRAGTKELAKRLRMHKGTAGDHLRRAEKHIMDDLFSSED